MTKNYRQVEGHPDLVKDSITGMIHNINKDKITQAKRARAQKIAERQELEKLKSDVNDIKQMLLKLLENKSNA